MTTTKTTKTTTSKLAKQISVCTACKLARTRTRAVPPEGATTARVMFVGIGPGRNEDETGRPFVGKAGENFDKILKFAGLKREDVWITNLVKCRPYEGRKNRDPKAGELEACSKFLEAEFEMVDPEIVIPLGNLPMKHLLELDGISKKRGQCFFREDEPNRIYFPLFHPAVLVYDKEGNLEDYKVDLRQLRRLLARLGIGKYGKAKRRGTPEGA